MTSAAPGNSDESIFIVAEPQNFNKDELIFYGTTENAGKIMVTKTVSDKEITVDGKTFMPTANNFNVFLSQAAQSYGLTTETSVSLDVVFVLDMSNSMLNGNSSKWLNMINAANSAIKSVLSANEDNRISVVGFSTTATVLSDLSSDYSATEDHLTYTRSQYGYSSTITVTGGQRNKSISTPVFYNTFTPNSITINPSFAISATKEIQTPDGSDAGMGFDAASPYEFEIKDSLGTVIATGNNDEHGNIVFENIEFKKVGTETFTIVELNEGEAGIVYDNTVHTVKVVVTDNRTGKLSANVGYTDNMSPIFNNIDYVDTKATIVVNKNLQGRDLRDSEFSFELKDEENNLLDTQSNASDGAISFTVDYVEPGVYNYTVNEVKGNLPGVTYSEHVCNVQVTVTEDEGVLSARVEYLNDTTFTNTYDRNSHKTGDVLNHWIWISMLLVSVSGIGVATTKIKKKETENN